MACILLSPNFLLRFIIFLLVDTFICVLAFMSVCAPQECLVTVEAREPLDPLESGL